MVKRFYQENRMSIWLAGLAYVFYMLMAVLYYYKTNIFFNTGKYDVLFDTDTGILFRGDWFFGTAADMRHFLFRNFMSPFVLPIKLIFGTDALSQHPTLYGLYLVHLQIIFMAVNSFIVLKLMDVFEVRIITRVLLGLIFILSWPQLLFALNIERYFLGQFSLLLFLYLVYKGKTTSMFTNALAGILLAGTTITNLYLYLVHLVTQKMSWVNKLKHFAVFSLLFYYVLLFGGGGGPVLSVLQFFTNYTEKFTEKYSYFELPGKIFTQLLYPAVFPPLHDQAIKDAFFQTVHVKWIPSILVVMVLITCVYAVWKRRTERLVQLLGFILLANITLHGFMQFGLKNAALYSTHLNFAIILLMGVFSTVIAVRKQKWVNLFLLVVLAVNLYETFQLFWEIYQVGTTYYPRG